MCVQFKQQQVEKQITTFPLSPAPSPSKDDIEQ